MALTSWKALAAVLALAAGLRVWGAFDIVDQIEDEPIHVATARSLARWGTTTNNDWAHPPLGGLLLAGSIAVLGDGPRGWRAGNVLLGSATVLLIFLVALRLYPGTAVPLPAAALLALDPFHVYHSRTTFMEVPVTFFFLLCLLLLLEHERRGRIALVAAGVAAGLTMATKAYFVVGIPLAVGFAIWRALRGQERKAAAATEILAAFLLPSAATYLLCHWPLFGRGYGFVEFLQAKVDAARAMAGYRAEEFLRLDWVEAGGRPWEWFLKPFLFGKELPAAEGNVRFLLEINNLPFRILALPSLLLAAAYAWKHRDPREALAPALFAGGYLLLLAFDRPIFSYSATVLLPFAYLATARGVDLVARRASRPGTVHAAFLTAVLLWGLYAYPLAAAKEVPRSPYRPVLPLVRLIGGA